MTTNLPNNHAIAILAGDKDSKSIRQEMLSSATRDMIAAAFEMGLCNAIEIRVGETECRSLFFGEGNCYLHNGSMAGKYFNHLNDPDFAIVYAYDASGDQGRGAILLARFQQLFATDKSTGDNNGQ